MSGTPLTPLHNKGSSKHSTNDDTIPEESPSSWGDHSTVFNYNDFIRQNESPGKENRRPDTLIGDKKPSMKVLSTSDTVFHGSNLSPFTPISTTFRNSKRSFIDHEHGEEEGFERQGVKLQGICTTNLPMISEIFKATANPNQLLLRKQIPLIIPKSVSQQLYEAKWGQDHNLLPNEDRYINCFGIKLIKEFHSSSAQHVELLPLEQFQPKLFSSNSFIEINDKKKRAWFKLTEQTSKRWEAITTRLLETEAVTEREIELCKRIFSSKNKMLKLQILANNQILGAGDSFSSTAGLPFQELDNRIFIIEARTSTGSNSEIEKEDEKFLGKGVGSNLRHIIYNAEVFGTPLKLNPPTKKRDTENDIHIKRPLNSYMLYRTSMMKISNVLSLVDSLTQLVNDIIEAYENGIVNTDYQEDEQDVFILRRINDIINDRDEIKATKFVDLLNARIAECQKVRHSSMGQIISLLWQTESPEIKETFHQFGKVEVDIHQAVNPGYKYKPSKRQKQ